MTRHRIIGPSLGLLAVAVLLATPLAQGEPESAPAPKRIHVTVALCDNQYQGIIKVGARIGDGDDPASNLYWGCSDGLWKVFDKAPEWQRIDRKPANEDQTILETLTYQHTTENVMLVAEAWRGREIKAATIRFLELLESKDPVDAPDLVAFIGHNGLMDFTLPASPVETGFQFGEPKRDAVVLCCRSRAYFSEKLKARNARPILMTEQRMYPGSFLLEAALDGWLKNESVTQIRERAARAYASNQKISTKAARGVFTDLAAKPEE